MFIGKKCMGKSSTPGKEERKKEKKKKRKKEIIGKEERKKDTKKSSHPLGGATIIFIGTHSFVGLFCRSFSGGLICRSLLFGSLL